MCKQSAPHSIQISTPTVQQSSTPSLNVYRLNSLPDAQPAVSKHWRHWDKRKQPERPRCNNASAAVSTSFIMVCSAVALAGSPLKCWLWDACTFRQTDTRNCQHSNVLSALQPAQLVPIIDTHTRLTTICPGLPGWASTRKVNQSGFYWSKRQWHQVGRIQICTSLQTDNHASTPLLSFLQVGCPSCCPTNRVKALKAITDMHQNVVYWTRIFFMNPFIH